VYLLTGIKTEHFLRNLQTRGFHFKQKLLNLTLNEIYFSWNPFAETFRQRIEETLQIVTIELFTRKQMPVCTFAASNIKRGDTLTTKIFHIQYYQ
jgi:hypothetical protein